MSKKFAEQIIDGMVDERGYCGERGLSYKQFGIIAENLVEGEWKYVTSWIGTKGGRRDFYACDYVGNVGKYRVVLNWYAHFNDRYTVKEICLRDADEYQAELDAEAAEAERRAAYKAMCEKSEWVGTPKKREDFELTLLKDYAYERDTYYYGGFETAHIYTLADNDGNIFVWKTTNLIELWDEDAEKYVEAEIGSKVAMRATVKEHGEYKGTKQTVLTRCKIQAIN